MSLIDDVNFKKHNKHNALGALKFIKLGTLTCTVATGGYFGVNAFISEDTTPNVLEIDATPQIDPETGYEILEDNIVEEQLQELVTEDDKYVGDLISYMQDAYYFDIDVTSDYGWGSFSASIDFTAQNLGANNNFDNCRVGPGVGKTGCTVSNADMSFNLTNIVHENNIVLGQHITKTENNANTHNNNEIIAGADITQPVSDYYTSKSDFGIGMVISPNTDSCKVTDTSVKNNSGTRDFNCITGKLIYNSVNDLDATSLTFVSVEDQVATFEANNTALTEISNYAYSSAGDLGTGSVSKAVYKIHTKGTIESDDDVILSSYFEYTNSYQTTDLITLEVNFSNWLVNANWSETDRVN